MLVKILEEGKKTYEAMDIPKDSLEFLYTQAYYLYNSGKYTQSQQIFFILLFLDEKEYRFNFGLAATYHSLKAYNEAIVFYMRCLALQPESPQVCFHMADCYQQLGKKEETLIALQMCVAKAEKDPKFEALKIRAKQLQDKLKQELQEAKK